LKPSSQKAHSRQRLFSKANTFWAFFSQVLDADGGCMEVVRKVQAHCSAHGLALPASSSSAYCQARKKLIIGEIMKVLDHTVLRLDSMPERGFLHGRRVVVVDGTGVSMPDTKANQAVWPQQSQQKEGCGFPTARICACFSLATGGLLSFKLGNKKSAELPLLREQANTFRKGDIFLGDKGFCSYFDMANFKKRGVDSVITLARRYPVSAKDAVKVLGENDLLIRWKKPVWNKRSAYTHDQWKALPHELLLRQIHVTVNVPGFRTESFYIITTLTDAKKSFFDLMDRMIQKREIVHIRSEAGGAVLMSEEEFESLQETLELLSTKGFCEDFESTRTEVEKGDTRSFEDVFGEPEEGLIDSQNRVSDDYMTERDQPGLQDQL
jgi:PHD/YefM family antitoxin component YafN of YafNO toxin-antitoxin module